MINRRAVRAKYKATDGLFYTGPMVTPASWTLSDGRTLDLSRPGVMGVLNVTPDSFSDGGDFIDPQRAVDHAAAMVEQGAAVIDIGGESTRPGAEPVSADQQVDRVVPVIEAVRRAGGKLGATPISIDTSLVAVADAALRAGADLINDVHAGRDPRNLPDGKRSPDDVSEPVFALAAQRDAPIILMHMLGQPGTMQQRPTYDNVLSEVIDFLRGRAAAAEQCGLPRERIMLDPGIGFGKTLEHNVALLRGLPELVALGYPVLVGASRKRFLRVVGRDTSEAERALARQPDAGTSAELLGGTCAVTAWAAQCGAALIRCHDVAENARAAAVGRALGAG